ncbi:large-conductance mechanosensitive channel protein MscL [Caproicibacterium sp. BJN0003]|uniref:large-conductance mechanosensitive channel protein MscL n=1 Tax=Caproicibacterium sp. BJN0003 TaxID=2994078 RepID=UPI00224D138E|nr:large-conductance mechanosensitive channel protein MscL [Caproicibacterium sp. BJN0003]UZT83189.1 large-conductance mechanosensitive channel protein MscL [Caproicibacterium sp. BJN0003]
MKKFIQEFKEFSMRGNVMDMAVGVVMGTAFSAIVTSLVKDIIMPLIGLLTGGLDFSNLSVTLLGKAVLTYGSFIQSVFNFLMISLSIFLMVKFANKVSSLRQKQNEQKEKVLEPSKEELLLTEIRDLLKSQSEK